MFFLFWWLTCKEGHMLPVSSTVCAAPMVLAGENGFLNKLGIKYEYVKTSVSSIQELIAAGKIDATMYMLSNAVLFQALNLRWHLKII